MRYPLWAFLFALATAGSAGACKVDAVVALPTPSPGASTTPPASPTPAPSPGTSVTAADVSGPWVFGTTNEPPAGAVPTRCIGYAATTLNLTQTGTNLTGTVSQCMAVCRLTENLSGTNDHGHVHLTGTATADGTAVTYDLDFNPTTKHLVGTRNGQPFWAAPATPLPTGPGGCPV